MALWLTGPVWGNGLVPGADVTGHLVRSDAGLEIVGDGHVDGWSPRFGLGYQQFLFYGQGFTWIVGLLKVVTLGLLSTAGAMKVVAVASFVATAPAAAFLARSLGLGARAAGVAAVLSLVPSSPFGVGLEGLFGTGLIPHQVGGVLFLVAFGAVVRTLTRPGRGWVALAVVTLTGLVLTHLISVAILAGFVACTVVVLALTRELDVRGLGRLATAAAGAAGLSAFWLVPFLAHMDLHGPVATWETPSFDARLAEVLDGRLLFEPLAAKVVLFAFGYGLVRAGRGRRYAFVICVVPLVVLGLSHWAAHAVTNEITLNLANRELGLVGIVLTFPAAAALAALSRSLHTQSWLPYGAALAVAVWLVVATTGDLRAAITTVEPKPELRAAARALRRLVPEHARFVTARDPSSESVNTGVVQPDRWLAWASGRNTLNTFPLETSSVPAAASRAEAVGNEPPSESAPALARFGVTHVVATSPPQASVLRSSSSFRPVWQEGTMTILEVAGPDSQPQPSSQVTTESPATATVRRAEPEELVIDVNAQRRTRATVAVAWSPKWHATLNGRPLELSRTPDGLLAAQLPAGKSRVALTFRSDGWDAVGIVVTGAVLLLAVTSLAGPRLPGLRWPDRWAGQRPRAGRET